MRLEQDVVRFTVIPDQGTQAWAHLPVDTIFDEDSYNIESNTDAINIEINIGVLNRALRSAFGASHAQLRLTKKDKIPLLALTVLATEWTEGNMSLATDNLAQDPTNTAAHSDVVGDRRARERETWITQEIPIKILGEAAVEGLHEPHCPDPEVHIALPGLAQLKSISDRFTRLASSDAKNRQPGMAAAAVGGVGTGEGTTGAAVLSTNTAPKLEFSANMHGKLKLAIATDELRIESYSQLPSERMRELGEDDELGWAKVRIDGKDWSRVLSIGRLSPKVVACFINDTALVLYVYLPNTYDGEESCLTYYINSFTT
ncbi:hypothetical protein N7470_007561 [Penicillium chermesinum]|nr:hypothetical protein N7470_007561 [Penicillium chermesinum]